MTIKDSDAKVSELHNFGDGRGPIPAHRHANGGAYYNDLSDCLVDAAKRILKDSWSDVR